MYVVSAINAILINNKYENAYIIFFLLNNIMSHASGLANPSSNTPPNTLEPPPSVYEYNSDFPPLRISHNK